MNLDSKSQEQWQTVTDLMQAQSAISLGKTASYWYRHAPRKMLDSLTYYKFAAKLIGKSKKVLDVGCGEGFGTFLLGKECGWSKGIDSDSAAITIGKNNFTEEVVQFAQEDIFKSASGEKFDAVVSFSTIEHISSESTRSFWRILSQQLKPEGLVIVGTPSPSSQVFSSTTKDPINPYTHDRLEAEISSHFEYVFPFGANGEVIHTSSLSSAQYYIVVGCKQKS